MLIIANNNTGRKRKSLQFQDLLRYQKDESDEDVLIDQVVEKVSD